MLFPRKRTQFSCAYLVLGMLSEGIAHGGVSFTSVAFLNPHRSFHGPHALPVAAAEPVLPDYFCYRTLQANLASIPQTPSAGPSC